MRHHEVDCGEIDESDYEGNEMALVTGCRLFSIYEFSSAHTVHGDRVCVITEADRSVTTVLWPGEY